MSGSFVGQLSVRCCALLLAGFAFLFAQGCQHAQQPTETGGTRSERARLGSSSENPQDARSGLEIRLMVVDDSEWTPARSLNQYADLVSSEIDPLVQEQWAQWGFRFVLVPMNEVDAVLSQFRVVQPSSVQWLGEFGPWRTIVRAGALRQPGVRVGEGFRMLDQGKPALIARSWIEPRLDTETLRAGIRLDLSVQLEQPKAKNELELLELSRDPQLEDSGPVLDELMHSKVHSGEYAIILVGESPEQDWDSLPDPQSLIDQYVELSSADDLGPDTEQINRESESSVQQPIQPTSPSSNQPSAQEVPGPFAPNAKTLGELMLMTDGSRVVELNVARVIPKRVVIALLPRVHGDYRLLTTHEATR